MQTHNHQYPLVFNDLSFSSLSNLLVIVLSKDVDQFLGIPGILDELDAIDLFEEELSVLLNEGVSLKSNWVNVVKFREKDNNFHWHKDEQYEGHFVGIYWLFGEVGKGGDLSMLIGDDEQRISFGPGKLIIFPKNILHQVSHYFGTQPRISLNFTF